MEGKFSPSLCDNKNVGKEYPQEGVLSPHSKNLVVDRFLLKLKRQNFYTQGYVDDLIILITEKYTKRVSELMEIPLSAVES